MTERNVTEAIAAFIKGWDENYKHVAACEQNALLHGHRYGGRSLKPEIDALRQFLPPSPPKLEPIVDWRPLAADALADEVRAQAIEYLVGLAVSKVIPCAQIEILADQKRREMHDLALRVFDTIHKRVTEQVED